MSSPSILCYVTGHGFGHLAQTAEVLISLARRWPESHFTVATSLPEGVTRQRIEAGMPAGRLRIVAEPTGADIGMKMFDAVTVNVAASQRAYARVLADWESHIATLRQHIASQQADLVLSNIAFLPLEAAQRAGIPAIAMGSLDWASIHARYCAELPGGQAVQNKLLDAYNRADAFIQLAPHLDMPHFAHRHAVAPVGRRGADKQWALRKALQCEDKQLGLVTMGGMAVPIPYDRWPRQDGLHWVISGEQPKRDDMSHAETLGFAFEDLLASVDFVVSKTGYGISVEAALNKTPILYLPRPDWPEEPRLLHWNQKHNRTGVIDRNRLNRGDLPPIYLMALRQPAPVPVAASGAEDASRIIASLV